MAELSASDLRCRVELLHRENVTTDLGTTEYQQVPYDPPRRIWAKITPYNGHRESAGSMDAPVITHRIQCRRSALPKIPSDLAFQYRGQIYEIVYGYPNYEQTGWLDFHVRLVVENVVDSF